MKYSQSIGHQLRRTTRRAYAFCKIYGLRMECSSKTHYAYWIYADKKLLWNFDVIQDVQKWALCEYGKHI